jgi:two-component system cell cycle response regulator
MDVMDSRHQVGAEQIGVLLIEDDDRAAAGIEHALRAGLGGGATISHARRLGDAEHVLRDRDTACVLLDSCRRNGGPLVAIGQIRSLAPDVAIVVIARQRDDELAVAALNLGAQDYLVKSELYPAHLGRAVHFAVERKRCERRLVSQALHDPLTGLPNRTLFLDRLGVALDRSRRTNATVVVMFLDVDDFKTVNDSFGHGAGDSVLAGVAAELRTMLRPMDTISRFGGDEFTVLVEDLSSQSEALWIAERIGRTAQTPIRLADREVSITVSIGITLVPDPTLAPETVIAQADSAMYRAKRLGPARHELFVDADRYGALERGTLERELRDAVERA